MQFNLINLFGLIIVIIMMIPSIIFAARQGKVKNQCGNRAMLVIEQIGRYASIVLMFFPLMIGKFGFHSSGAFLVYALGNAAFLLVYLIVWIAYFRKQSPKKALILAIVPTCIFLLSSIALMHWLLLMAAVLFGIGHIYVTYQNNKS